MKVKCTQCGKRFDYDVYMGMCPSCFAYYKMNGDAYHPTYSANASKRRSTLMVLPQEKKKTKRAKHSRSYHIATFVLCSIIILSIVFTLFLVDRTNESGYAASSLTEIPEPAAASVGTSVVVPYAENNFSFTITDAAVVQDSSYQVPAGYELVRISYHTGTSIPYGAPAESEYSFYSDFSIRWGLHPYLITKSGSYLPPLDNYDFEKLQILESEAADELELSTYFEKAAGSFYFLVKENDAKGLRINCHKEQTDAWGNSVEPLEACYEITDLEVY